jgi:hypothetical protein
LNVDQENLSVGDYVYRTCDRVRTRSGFGVLGDVITPFGDSIASITSDYRTQLLNKLFKTH